MNDQKKEFNYWQTILEDEYWMQVMSMIHKGKDVRQAALEAYGHLLSDPIRLERMDHGEFKRFVNGWLSNKRFPKQTFTRVTNHLK